MKKIAQMLVVMLVALSTHAASVQGDIILPFSVLDTNKTVQTKEVGDDVKATWTCRVGEFHGWQTIFAQVNMINKGSKPMWGQCSLAFYDSDKNLIGTTTQNFIARRGLKPGAKKAGMWRIILPKDRYKDVVSYQVVVNETTSPPSRNKETTLLEDP